MLLFALISLLLAEVPSLADEIWTLLWRRWMGTPLWPPAASGDTAFVASAGGEVYALKLKEGVAIWKFKAGRMMAGPALEGVVYVGDVGGNLYGLEGTSGKVLWVRSLWGEVRFPPACGSPGAYVVTGAGILYAFDRKGNERWRVRIPSVPLSGPAVAGGLVLVPCSDGGLRAYDAEEGRLAWISDVGKVTAGPSSAGDFVLAGCGGYAKALRLGDGGVAWSRFLGGRVTGTTSSAVEAFFVTSAGWAYCLDMADGRPVWKEKVGPSGDYGITASGGRLYISGPEGATILSSRRGEILRGWSTGEPARWAQPVSGGVLVSAGGFLYLFGPFTPRSHNPVWQEWAEVRYKGVKVGYRHAWAEEDSTGFVVSTDEVNWQNGFRRTSFRALTDSSYMLGELEGEYREADQLLTVEAKVDSGLLIAERRGPEVVLRDTFEVGPLVPSFALVRHLAVDSFSDSAVRVLDVRRLVPVEERVFSGPDTLDGVGCLRLEVGDGLTVWAEGSGRTLRVWSPSLKEEIRSVPQEEALAWEPPEIPLTVPLDVELPPFRKVGELTLRFPYPVGLPSNGRQKVQRAKGCMEVKLTQSLPEDTTSPRRYLGPTVFLQTEHPEILKLAEKLSEGDPEERARRALDWVYSHIRPEETAAKFLTALEVLREGRGTCTEHSVLFVALCRAMGVPARAALGLLGAGRRLVPHMWAQVHLGTWVDVDPSYGQFGVDGAHLALAYADVSLKELPEAERVLQMALANWDTAQVVRVRADGDVYLPEAERLWKEADKAEQSFKDDEAIGLLRRLISLPENRLTAPALYRLGVLLVRKGRKEEAEGQLLKLLEEFPGSEEVDDALYKLAEISYNKRRALKFLKRLVEEFPDSPLADDALHREAEIYLRLGERGKAEEALRLLSERYPDSPWARRGRR